MRHSGLLTIHLRNGEERRDWMTDWLIAYLCGRTVVITLHTIADKGEQKAAATLFMKRCCFIGADRMTECQSQVSCTNCVTQELMEKSFNVFRLLINNFCKRKRFKIISFFIVSLPRIFIFFWIFQKRFISIIHSLPTPCLGPKFLYIYSITIYKNNSRLPLLVITWLT